MTSLVFSIIGKDAGASKALQNVSKSADQSADSLKKLKVAAAVGLVAVTAAAVKFGVSSVKAYSQAQTAQNKLQDAFARFPRLADTNITALRGLNTALAQKTRFDDDATASGQAVLAQFKLTGQQITQLTPLLQDYAAKTGKDLPTAARDLGKAMLGQGRSLKAVGIDFKDTGTAGGNFAQIMSGLRTQVGGFAEREGKTAAGQMEILKNQFGELQESAGAVLLPALTKLVGGAVKVINAFNGLSSSTKATVLGMAGGITAFSLTALAVGKLVTVVRSAKLAFQAFGIASKTAVVGIPVLGAVLAAAGAVMGIFAGRAQQAKDRTEAIGEAVHTVTGELTLNTAALNENVRSTTAKALQDAKALDAATKLGIGLETLTDAALGNQTAIAEVHAKMLAAYQSGNSVQVQAASKLASSFGSVSKSVGDAIAKENQYRAAVGGAGDASRNAATAVNLASKKVDDSGKKAKTAEAKFQALAAAMFKTSAAGLELSGTEISFQQAIDDATRAAKANGKTLDLNTQKGRDNKTALNGQVTASQAYIQKLIAMHKSSKQVTQATQDARASFIKNATAMGVSRDRARELADRYFKIPKKIVITHTTPGGQKARDTVQGLAGDIRKLKGKNAAIEITINSHLNKLNQQIVSKYGLGAKKIGIASGGEVPGHSPHDRADDVPANLTSGEWVIQRPTARKYGKAAMKAVNDGRATIGYAAGGEVNVRSGVHGQTYDYMAIRNAAYKGVGGSGAAMAEQMGNRVLAASSKAALAASKAAQAASMVTLGGASSFSGKLPGGTGAAGIRAIARALGASYIAPHRDPQGGPAFDLGSSGAKNDRIAAALISAHGRLGLRYVIHRMRIASARSGWRNRAYHPITGSGDFRHVNHVHVSYDRGGWINEPVHGVGRSGRTYSFAEKRREYVTPNGRSSGGGGVTVVINAPNYIGSRSELKQTLVDMARTGGFDAVLAKASRR